MIVEPEERFQSTVAAVETLKTATTLGQLQQSPLPAWARAVVDAYVEALEDEGYTLKRRPGLMQEFWQLP